MHHARPVVLALALAVAWATAWATTSLGAGITSTQTTAGPYEQFLDRVPQDTMNGTAVFRANADGTKRVLAIKDSTGTERGVRFYATPSDWAWVRARIMDRYPGCSVPSGAPTGKTLYNTTASGTGYFRWRPTSTPGYTSLEVVNSSGSIVGGRIGGTARFWCWVRNRIENGSPAPGRPGSDPGCASKITTWRPPSATFVPLSDAAAAARVCNSPEQRPGNADENAFAPTEAQVDSTMGVETDRYGRTIRQFHPDARYVTGNFKGTTDDILEWAANKWGIPEDWVRAQAQNESNWRMSQLGDRVAVPDPTRYPALSRIPGTRDVDESLGIMQVRWNEPRTGGTTGIGSEPWRWRSTAFNVDYYASYVRYYYDGQCGWCGSGYSAGQEWNSIGAWYNPSGSPWGVASDAYEQHVRDKLAARAWTRPGF